MECRAIHKFFTLHGRFQLLDEQGKVLYACKRRLWLSPSRYKVIKNAQGEATYFVKNRLVSGLRHHAFLYDTNKEQLARISYTRLISSEPFRVEEGGNLLQIHSLSLAAHEVLLRGAKVGTIRYRMGFFFRHYDITIDDPKYAGFVFAVAMALNNLTNKESGRD